MSNISISGLKKRYGPAMAVENFNLEVDQGEMIVFLGPSGCGKTTTLRMIAGFIDPTEGSIKLSGREITGVPAYDRNIGLVPQNYALFPHLSVFENVAFGLRRRKTPEQVIATKVEEVLALVRMDPLSKRMPRELSGGQQQRVAIARAIVISPDILLMDEPLSNLDAKLRVGIRQEIKRLQKSLGITTILVTHDQEEAMSIADRVVVMSEGRIRQIGRPEGIYARPDNPFVADFIGHTNFIPGKADGDFFEAASGIRLALPGAATDHDVVVIRPEQIEIAASPTLSLNEFAGEVISKIYLGAVVLLECRIGQDLVINVAITSSEALSTVAEGATVYLTMPPDKLLTMRSDEQSPENARGR
ncbi:ABC transporter ATP-binding protein [Bosea vestrisii]|uniref:ABC transporter ATP-binding protein n=1 Tax=Bosea vestrisii TaxID=151416 RepID=UPI0024DF9CE5|nr:ABC transporter ATP-binding protein [Bosea vestrisii]WID95224.1 ABC transporter ATP-binding protein [Bosea vestrisii]